MLNYLKQFLFVSCFILASSSVAKVKPVDAAYIQIDAFGSMLSIDKGGVKACDIILFGFADVTKHKMEKAKVDAIHQMISYETPNTINLLSIGGGATTEFGAIERVIYNVDSQIKQINSSLSENKITGVDLDLEGEFFTSEYISKLAKAFKTRGYKVSIAPQVYTSGGNINSKNPHNFIFTSCLKRGNNFKNAIASGNVDYIMLQTYNSGGFKIDGFDENQVGFYSAAAKAIKNIDYLPKHTKVLIGQVANQCSGGRYTIFNPQNKWPLPTNYNQISILKKLKEEVYKTLDDRVIGIMLWSLNNDYQPAARDKSAKPAAFSMEIFDSPKPDSIYFIMQVSNIGKKKHSSISLLIDGKYYVFGKTLTTTIAPGVYEVWGTSAAAKTQPEVVVNSLVLDSFFKDKNEVTATIIGNSYNEPMESLLNPHEQFTGGEYKFSRGTAYNILINPSAKIIEVKEQ